jgi:hypothetical protein
MRSMPQKPDAQSRDDKWCARCGRVITWRSSLAKNWDSVKWCSDGCRKRGLRAIDEQLSSAILDLLTVRARDATICPSEAARHVGGAEWEDLMEPARCAARRLVVEGKIVITQGGRVVDPSTAKGPIRLRRA